MEMLGNIVASATAQRSSSLTPPRPRNAPPKRSAVSLPPQASSGRRDEAPPLASAADAAGPPLTPPPEAGWESVYLNARACLLIVVIAYAAGQSVPAAGDELARFLVGAGPARAAPSSVDLVAPTRASARAAFAAHGSVLVRNAYSGVAALASDIDDSGAAHSYADSAALLRSAMDVELLDLVATVAGVAADSPLGIATRGGALAVGSPGGALPLAGETASGLLCLLFLGAESRAEVYADQGVPVPVRLDPRAGDALFVSRADAVRSVAGNFAVHEYLVDLGVTRSTMGAVLRVR